MDINELKNLDEELFSCLEKEKSRQENNLEMIASESIQPSLSLALAGSIFNNKTAVGLPDKQRLKGSTYITELERLCARRACEVFGADHANMLPYSGSVANYCAYKAVLNTGDRVVALEPSAGSHQTHGGSKNVSSSLYKFAYFGLDKDTLLIDYEGAEKLCKQYKPKLVVVGSAAYSRDIDYALLARIAHECGAYLMVDVAHFSGLIATQLAPNPFPHADIVTASTTKTMCGPHSGFIMCKKELASIVDNAVYPGTVASLHLQTIAAMAYALKNSQTAEFRTLMQNVIDNSKYFCSLLKTRGFSIVTGGTDCHMFVADLRAFNVDCEKVATVFEEIGITVNTKAIPYDESPTPRGIRAGVTVLTQRGFTRPALEKVADVWLKTVQNLDNREILQECKQEVEELCRQFPIPQLYE